jgi:pyrimidine operon attenuation protein/uracil phosphoribosyltransferase
MSSKALLESRQLNQVLLRLAYEIWENHGDFSHTVLLGLQPRGVILSRRLHQLLQTQVEPGLKVEYGELDITFFRDDVRRHDAMLKPSATVLPVSLEGKRVVLVDDVLYTGRTIRAGLEAMLAYGRPDRVELAVLVDRVYARHLPIQPHYTGIRVDTIASERVRVQWDADQTNGEVWLESTQ